VDLSRARTVPRLQAETLHTRESCSCTRWRIGLGVKLTGERSAGNPHSTFEVAGVWKPVHGIASESTPRGKGEPQVGET